MRVIRHAGQVRFIRATDHQADAVAGLWAQGHDVEVRLDDRPRFSGQTRMEWARERCLLTTEMMIVAHRAAPELYAYIGEL